MNFEDAFSPVASLETVRLVLAMAVQMKWLVCQHDVKFAFLKGELSKEVHVDQPRDYEVIGKEKKVYRPKKPLYELRQAPHPLYIKIDTLCGTSYLIRHLSIHRKYTDCKKKIR